MLSEEYVSRDELQEDLTNRVTQIMSYVESNAGVIEDGLGDEECGYVLNQLQELLSVIDTDI